MNRSMMGASAILVGARFAPSDADPSSSVARPVTVESESDDEIRLALGDGIELVVAKGTGEVSGSIDGRPILLGGPFVHVGGLDLDGVRVSSVHSELTARGVRVRSEIVGPGVRAEIELEVIEGGLIEAAMTLLDGAGSTKAASPGPWHRRSTP
jgi:hypothetical protein